MNSYGAESSRSIVAPPKIRRGLFRKYVSLFIAVVCVTLIANGMFEIWFSYQEQRTLLLRIQREQAEAAATKITYFVREIENQIDWTTQLPWMPGDLEERRIEVVRLLRQTPAITQLAELDRSGREQLRVSRLAKDVVGSQADFSQDASFIEAVRNKIYYGSVYFLRESEPYMTLAMAGDRLDAAVSVAEINLKFIWDLVSEIRVGARGRAYVVDAQGRLIAHPDISFVLRKMELSHLTQVRAARLQGSADSSEQVEVAEDLQGRRVLTAYAPVAPLGWLLFVELPVDEAYSPLFASIARSGVTLLAALALAVIAGMFLARRMVGPIQALQAGAARIGSGDLGQRISITSGDELEALGDQFNNMAAQLQDSYATLERKVEERTHQLELANLAKSRFLAAASHDLRQPLHALGLFVAHLRTNVDPAKHSRLVEQIDVAVSGMNELFNALLDISKLDAGVLTPNITEFPIEHLLNRTEATFAAAARERGLSLRVVPNRAWIRSDFILLERILLNLVSNAVRYTQHGGVVVGCRRRDSKLRVEVWDSGPGIPKDQRRNIFGEFYQLMGPELERHGGLGLGLAIVERLCRLLDHSVELTSTVGKGSRFAVVVPLVPAQTMYRTRPAAAPVMVDALKGRLIVVIDDDPLVLESMSGLLQSWNCQVVTATSDSAALVGITQYGRPPDLIISDYHLAHGRSGIETIELLCGEFHAPIPAFLISGDINPERLREAQARGYHLQRKPVGPAHLRALMSQLLKSSSDVADTA